VACMSGFTPGDGGPTVPNPLVDAAGRVLP
jgi:hypothetical protein